jgi:predicted enzyme related to lactoylglutathione lyase
MQFQMLAKRPDEAAKFYATLFDWKVNADNPLGYRVIDTGSPKGIQGGIWPAPPEGQAVVQLYVEVDDVAEHVERAKKLGARVIVPPQHLPQGEVMAILIDVEGLPFGVFSPAKRA